MSQALEGRCKGFDRDFKCLAYAENAGPVPLGLLERELIEHFANLFPRPVHSREWFKTDSESALSAFLNHVTNVNTRGYDHVLQDVLGFA